MGSSSQTKSQVEQTARRWVRQQIVSDHALLRFREYGTDTAKEMETNALVDLLDEVLTVALENKTAKPYTWDDGVPHWVVQFMYAELLPCPVYLLACEDQYGTGRKVLKTVLSQTGFHGLLSKGRLLEGAEFANPTPLTPAVSSHAQVIFGLSEKNLTVLKSTPPAPKAPKAPSDDTTAHAVAEPVRLLVLLDPEGGLPRVVRRLEPGESYERAVLQAILNGEREDQLALFNLEGRVQLDITLK